MSCSRQWRHWWLLDLPGGAAAQACPCPTKQAPACLFAKPQRLIHHASFSFSLQIVKKKVQVGDDARGRFSQAAKEYVR